MGSLAIITPLVRIRGGRRHGQPRDVGMLRHSPAGGCGVIYLRVRVCEAKEGDGWETESRGDDSDKGGQPCLLKDKGEVGSKTMKSRGSVDDSTAHLNERATTTWV